MEIMALTDFKIFIAITATIVGGIWGLYLFIAERNHLPKLEIQITANCSEYHNEKTVIYSKIKVKNIGKTPIRPTNAQVKLQQISPPLDDKSRDPNKFNYISPHDESVLWPLIGERNWTWNSGDFLLEPGESDELDVDFLVFDNIHLVRIYGFIQNPILETGGWNSNITFNIKKSCQLNHRPDTENKNEKQAK